MPSLTFYPGAAASVALESGRPWITPGNALAQDVQTTHSTASDASTLSTHLVLTDFGIAGQIPAGSTIDGIVVEWLAAKTSNDSSAWIQLRETSLWKDDALWGIPFQSTLQIMSNTLQWYQRGSDTDVAGAFGVVPTVAELEDPGFGIALRAAMVAVSGISTTAHIDHMRIVVYYTEPLNDPPQIVSGPTLDYAPYGKISPNNPATLSFTATDDNDQGVDELGFEVRTAAAGGGTLVTSGSCTHNVEEQVQLTSAMLEAAGVPEDTDTTLYLRVQDLEMEWSTDGQFVARAIYAHQNFETDGQSNLLLVSTGFQVVTDRSGELSLLLQSDGAQIVTDLSGQDVVVFVVDGPVSYPVELSGESVIHFVTDGITMPVESSGESVLRLASDGLNWWVIGPPKVLRLVGLRLSQPVGVSGMEMSHPFRVVGLRTQRDLHATSVSMRNPFRVKGLRLGSPFRLRGFRIG